MSVIITGMEKHEDCYDCEFHTNYRTNDYGSFCECMFDDEYNRINLLEHKIPNFCPLKSIDGLIEKVEQLKKSCANDSYGKCMTNAISRVEKLIKEYCEVQNEHDNRTG